MTQPIVDYLQHFSVADLATPMFRVIDRVQNEPDPRRRVAAVLMTALMMLEHTTGVERGLQAGLKALNHLKLAEADEFKAMRDYIAQEIRA